MSRSQELEHLLPLSEYQVVARAVVRGQEGPLSLYSDTVYFNTAGVYLVQVLRCTCFGVGVVVRGEKGPLSLYSDTVYFNTASVYLVQVLRCRLLCVGVGVRGGGAPLLLL